VALSLRRLHSEAKMKSVLSRSLARAGLVLFLGSATVLFLTAAQKKEARVSQAVRDVNLLAPGTTDRPAHLNENITDGSAVHTGVASRAELTFPDLTITRIGANSIFSFEEHGRNVNVENGAILLRVPSDSGGARIRSSALTVGISGTTVMFEYHRRTYTKLIVLEGSGEAWLTKYPGNRVRVRGGQMLMVRAGATRLPEPVDIDLDRLLRTATLITAFPPLPSLDLIRNVANSQKRSGGPLLNPLIDPTGMGARDVNASARPQSTPFKPPGGRNRNP
jgi:mannose-6-phosphate isomerase-like protein (cupin superfamily)